MGEPETVVATPSDPAHTVVATPSAPARFERQRGEALIERLERCRDRVRAITEKLAGPRPRPTNIEQKKLAASIDLLDREIAALEECL